MNKKLIEILKTEFKVQKMTLMKTKKKKKNLKMIKIIQKKISGITEINTTPKMKITFTKNWKTLELDYKPKFNSLKK